METIKERYEKRIEACNEAIDEYNDAENGMDIFAISDARFKMIIQLLCYLNDSKYYITELEAQIRANEQRIKMLEEDRKEAWRFCKL